VSTSDGQARLIRVFLSELDERLGTFDAGLVALERPSADDERAEIVTRLFRDAHSLKGAAASVGVSSIEMMCQQLEDTLAALRDGTRTLDDACCESLFAAADAVREAGRAIAAPAPTPPTPPAAPSAPAPSAATPAPEPPRPRIASPLHDATLRVGSEKIDALLEQSGELLVAHHRTQDLYRDVVEAGTTVQRLRDAPAGDANEAKRRREELHELHRSLERIAAAMEVERALLQRASNELDDGIRSIRLLPFGRACEGLDRVVRDASKATGKRVRLEIAGSEVGVDRATIERLRDPLVQLIRNAIDHGIEEPAERTRRGKAAEGTLMLSARPRTRNLEVVVSDDGSGLDLDALRRRVTERGLDFDDTDLARAVFLPGISTAASVTSLSGRGVGLDVVRTEVEALNGTVEITTKRGAGTSFVLTLPLTSTTLRAILVTAGEETFGINVSSVDRVVRIDADNVAYVEGRSLLLGGGDPIPLVPLHAVLGIEGRSDSEPPAIALIVSGGGRSVALGVDALIDEREVHLRTLGPRLRGLLHVAGAAIASDGSIALILRSSSLLESALTASRIVRTPKAPVTGDIVLKRVLLVDDSVTTRTLERSILEAAGYAVVTAQDGAAAWQLLGEEPVDLVVSDVDMPRMDGFSLVEAIRASTSLRELPVILVTARENEIDRQRGLDAGADAYIVKSSFRQEELLDAIGSLT
jgi:two-component system chemotaxis sensor kinase CheA